MTIWQESLLVAGEAAVPGIFVPPTGTSYSLNPPFFNAAGDLVVEVNIETV